MLGCPTLAQYSCVDLRTVSYEVPPQEMLSRDSVTVSVDAVCFYKVGFYIVNLFREILKSFMIIYCRFC